MKVYYNLNNISIENNSAVSVGFFDGVHRGHKYVINSCVDIAKQKQLVSIIVSMWPHPLSILNNQTPDLLSSLDEKISLIAQTEVDILIILPFNKQLAGVSQNSFIRDILINILRTKYLIIGFNNSFGKDSSEENIQHGDIKTIYLNKYESNHNIPVNSTNIRKCLKIGDIELATELLGYYYKFKGVVAEGYKVGRQIGFPTANLVVEDEFKLIPASGVYIVEANIDNSWLPAMLNIGKRPTFGEFNSSIEFHILNFSGDLYKSTVEIRFLKKIRNEKRFKNVGELVNQLHIDKEITESFFKTQKK